MSRFEKFSLAQSFVSVVLFLPFPFLLTRIGHFTHFKLTFYTLNVRSSALLSNLFRLFFPFAFCSKTSLLIRFHFHWIRFISVLDQSPILNTKY